MIFLLSFLLSWFSGLLVILVFAFVSYEEFSIIDITSFAVLTLVISVLVISFLYQLTLKVFRKLVNERNLFIYCPAILILLANIPVYFAIWLKEGDLYGKEEAKLFTLCFITTAAVFGCCMAWKNKMLKKE
jgi:hypothetical protein